MFEEIEFQHDDDAYARTQDLKWKRENQDLLLFVEHVAKNGYGTTQLELVNEARALLAKSPLEECPHCGELGEDLQEVESRDDEVGYYDVQVMCAACRRAPREREAAAEGGLRADALALLGVDASWMYEGSTPPGKPVAREVRAAIEEEGYGD